MRFAIDYQTFDISNYFLSVWRSFLHIFVWHYRVGGCLPYQTQPFIYILFLFHEAKIILQKS